MRVRELIGLASNKPCYLADDTPTGEQKDFEVKSYGAVLDIKDVPLYSFSQLTVLADLSDIIFDLRHARHARQHFEPNIIIGDLFGIKMRMEQHMRAWANNTHVAEQDIKELRCFIKMGDAQKFTDTGDPFVIDRNLFQICLVVHEHRAELKAIKLNTEVAGTFLNKKNGAPG